jgi:hypothetical protein
MNASFVVAILIIALGSSAIEAQKPPPPRALGSVVRTSTNSLASAATALPMPDGRIIVNDITARRVLLFDSTLTKVSIVADTTGATANAYGTRAGTLIQYRGDSALYIDIGSLSMLVIGPTGKIERIIELPVSRGTSCMFGGENLDVLYVTTMRGALTDAQSRNDPALAEDGFAWPWAGILEAKGTTNALIDVARAHRLFTRTMPPSVT